MPTRLAGRVCAPCSGALPESPPPRPVPRFCACRPPTPRCSRTGRATTGASATSCRPGPTALTTPPSWRSSRPPARRPEHNDDQLAMYSNLTTAAGSITPATIPDYFKDATFGVPAGRRREHRDARARGDDRARQAVRRAPHLRRHPRRADVRDRLCHRRGPAVLHRRAAPRRSGRPRVLRRRRQRRDGRGGVGRRALHPAGPRQPGQ